MDLRSRRTLDVKAAKYRRAIGDLHGAGRKTTILSHIIDSVRGLYRESLHREMGEPKELLRDHTDSCATVKFLPLESGAPAIGDHATVITAQGLGFRKP